MSFRSKIIAWEDLPRWRTAWRASGKKVVVTNGCFDLLHIGHVTYLEAARALGDVLLVGVNSDSAVRELKGPSRPITSESDRLAILAALESVTSVCLFQEKRATQFLARAQPDIYVKGGDYSRETLDSSERDAVEKAGAQIIFIPLIAGKSTTATLQRLSGS